MLDLKIIMDKQDEILKLAQQLGFKKIHLFKSSTVGGLGVLVDLGEPEIAKDIHVKSNVLTYKISSMLNCFVVVVSNLDLDEARTNEFKTKSIELPITSPNVSAVNDIFGTDFKALTIEESGSDYQFRMITCRIIAENYDKKSTITTVPKVADPITFSATSSGISATSDEVKKDILSKQLPPSV